MKLAETELNREVLSEAEWLIARKDPARTVVGIIEPDTNAK